MLSDFSYRARNLTGMLFTHGVLLIVAVLCFLPLMLVFSASRRSRRSDAPPVTSCR